MLNNCFWAVLLPPFMADMTGANLFIANNILDVIE